MKALVICEVCGQKILECKKDRISDNDLKELEQSAMCEDHGGNSYTRDEDGVITSQDTFVIKAIRTIE